MMKRINKKENFGITLIALVITIVVLIILAAVAINLSLGENGLFNRAKYASEKQKFAAAKEAIEIKIADVKMKCQAEGRTYSEAELENELANSDDFIIQYYFEDTAAVRNGATRPTKVKSIAVSTKSESEFVFKIDDGGEIEGVTKTKNPESLTASSFVAIDVFDVDNGPIQSQTPTQEPTATPTPTPIPTPEQTGLTLTVQYHLKYLSEDEANPELYCCKIKYTDANDVERNVVLDSSYYSGGKTEYISTDITNVKQGTNVYVESLYGSSTNWYDLGEQLDLGDEPTIVYTTSEVYFAAPEGNCTIKLDNIYWGAYTISRTKSVREIGFVSGFGSNPQFYNANS